MRSLAGDRRDTDGALRLRSSRLSSEEEGYGEWLACRARGFGDGRWEDEERDAEPLKMAFGCLGLGFGAGRSTTTFSILILGGSILNLLFLLPNRRILY